MLRRRVIRRLGSIDYGSVKRKKTGVKNRSVSYVYPSTYRYQICCICLLDIQ